MLVGPFQLKIFCDSVVPPKLRDGSHIVKGKFWEAQPGAPPSFCLGVWIKLLFFPAVVGGSRQSILGFCNLYDLGVDHI